MEHNQAVDGLLSLFAKANRDLSAVNNKLHKEFEQIYPDNSNPMKLVERLKRIDEVLHLPDLIERARTLLFGIRTILQRLQASTGVRCSSHKEMSFNQVADEWAVRLKS